MNTQYASYEETAIVETYTYTATVVTEQGESTQTLTARQDLDNPRRRQICCPKCHNWYRIQWEGCYQLPVHCNKCVIGLYDLQQVVETTEPAVEEAAEVLTAEVVAAGIEHYRSVLAQWDATVEEVAARIDNVLAVVDAQLAETATQAEPATYTYMILPDESRPFIHQVAEKDEPLYGLQAEQAYYLCRSESLSRCTEQSIYHVVVWSYEQCRWVCPCASKRRTCKHTKLINQDCRDRARQSNGEQQQAA